MDTLTLYLVMLIVGVVLTVAGVEGLIRYKSSIPSLIQPSTIQVVINQPSRVVISGQPIQQIQQLDVPYESEYASVEELRVTAPSLSFGGEHKWLGEVTPEPPRDRVRTTTTLILPSDYYKPDISLSARKRAKLEARREKDEYAARTTANVAAQDPYSLHVWVLGCAYAVERDGEGGTGEGLQYYHTFEGGVLTTHPVVGDILVEIRGSWERIK